MLLGSSLALGPTQSSGGADLLRSLFNRAGVAIAGRDGTLVQSGGTGSTALHPTTAAVQSSGSLISHNLVLGGVGVLPMSFAQGARTNLCSAVTNNTQLASNTLSGVSRTIVENGVSAFREAYSANITLSDATSYACRSIVSRASGTRHASVVVERTGQASGVVINMDTGALTNVTAGGGSVTSAAAVSLGGGRWLVTFLVASSAWGGTPQLHLGITNSATTRATYLGDGVSGVTFEAVTLEAATFSGLGLAEGATRTADNILWTPPAALSQDFELVHIGAQYLVSGDSGLASQTWFEGTAIGETRLLRLSATSAAYREWNGTTAYVDDITRTLPSSGTLFSHFARRRSTPQNVELGYAGVLSGSPTASTGTLQAETAIRIGHSNTASRASHAFNGLLYVPGGLTDSERSALARLTAGSLNYVG